MTFDELLDIFWQEHDPCGAARSTQYKAILFHHDESQRQVAQAAARAIAALRGGQVTTELVLLDRFWVAEDYHQKYALRRHKRLMESLAPLFASEAEFRDSPLTARLNAFCAGDLDQLELDRAIAQLGYRLRQDGCAVERR